MIVVLPMIYYCTCDSDPGLTLVEELALAPPEVEIDRQRVEQFEREVKHTSSSIFSLVFRNYYSIVVLLYIDVFLLLLLLY
jgi:hypothetical protein